MSTGYDYTQQTAASEAESFQIGRVKATKSADQIEQEAADREYRQIPVGDHILTVAGFVKAPEPKQRNCYVDGVARQYTVYQVGVRLALEGDPQAQTVEWLDLPPYQDSDLNCYLYGSKNSDGRNAGFGASKFFQFIGRLNPAWHVEPGQELPDDALTLGNWMRRRVVATIETGKVEKDPATQAPKVNPNTGLPFEPRNQVKLFSYKAVDGGGAGRPASAPGPATTAPQAPRPHQPQPAAAMAGAGVGPGVGSAPASASARPGLRRSI